MKYYTGFIMLANLAPCLFFGILLAKEWREYRIPLFSQFILLCIILAVFDTLALGTILNPTLPEKDLDILIAAFSVSSIMWIFIYTAIRLSGMGNFTRRQKGMAHALGILGCLNAIGAIYLLIP